ncbi:hypothetical protein MPSEU_000773000 [Mayamaea pseudoterrestris]|nr:hypothetical protein MPSEU_000773000 [Mayamaea pseudoterrestris]
MRFINLHASLLLACQLAAIPSVTLAFAPPTRLVYNAPAVTARSHTQLSAVALDVKSLPNPFKKLPWIAAKEKQRQVRRFQQERAMLHRQLGIPPEATYEEIVAATDRLIAANAGDLKKKVQIEIAKDKILQIRLNERLAGLAEIDSAAMKQSLYEKEGADEDDVSSKVKADKEENSAPAWTRGLIVKPDAAHAKAQLRLWGIITAIGVALPPSQDYIGRFAWLVCVAQLTFRGMPKEEQESGGMAMNFNTGGGGNHRKVAFAIGFGTWCVGSFLVYTVLMPSWAKGQRWTGSVAFALMNLIFGLVSSYFQPYKG